LEVRLTAVVRGLVLVVAIVGTRVLEAQTVRGEITDRVTGRLVHGAVVLLLDGADRTVAQGITDARGQYRLVSDAPGAFRVRALRIGFRPATSQSFTLAAGAELTLPPLRSGDPVALDTIRVVGRNSCSSLSDTRITFALWEQARIALTAARITAGERLMSARIMSYQRTFRPRNGEMLSLYASERSGFTQRPWRSIPPDSLSRVGYMVQDEQNWLTFYAPDLDVLLSDQFLAEHCFRIAPESDRARIGLAFEPTRERRDLPEIRGTLWLDRATSELRRLDFRYVGIPAEMMDADAGGLVEFAHLPHGAWVVSRWNIRMPVIVQRFEAASGVRSRARVAYRDVREVKEDGGVLVLATRGQDTLYTARPIAITGTVRDSVKGSALADALVALRGTTSRTSTDSRGHFRLANVLPGRYVVEFRTPELEALGAIHAVPVTVTDSGIVLSVALPSAEQLGELVCRGARGVGVIAGTVYRAGGDSVARAGTRVVGEFRDKQFTANRVANAALFSDRTRWVNATTDLHGRYRLCQVPVGATVQVVAETDSSRSGSVMVTLPETLRVAVADLVLDRTEGRPAAFAGVVMSDVDGRPIPQAQVLLPDLPRHAFSDDAGSFRISNIPAGTHKVVVRRLGYRQSEMTLAFAAHQTLERRLLLSAAVTLDTVAVSARAEIPSFEENRRVGLGRFWTRDVLERMEGRFLSEVMSEAPGASVVRGAAGSTAWLAGARGGRGGGACFDLDGETKLDSLQGKNCGCYAQVYLDNMPLFLRRQMDEVPNLNRIPISAIEAIEFYRSPAETPAKYSTLNSTCGVLVIHTRRTLDRKSP
jgi:hypothetical protein